jgi:hypothetical protein
MITIQGKALGRKKPLFADWSTPFPPDLGDGGSLTLRDLVSRVVRTEVEAFKKRQQERRLLSKVLLLARDHEIQDPSILEQLRS